MKTDSSITIEIDDRKAPKTFRDVSELTEFAEAAIERNSLDSYARAAIRRLASMNGAASDRVREVARTMDPIPPPRDDRGPTPFDARIVEAEAALEAARAEHHAADRRWRDRADQVQATFRQAMARAGNNIEKQLKVETDFERFTAELWDLKYEAERAREAAGRALVLFNMLQAARGRFWADRRVRIVNPDDPSGPGLTLAEYAEWRQRHAR